jgi:hypothetical protein
MNVIRVALSATLLALLADPLVHAQQASQYPPAWPRLGSTTLVENNRGAAYNVTYLKDRPSPMHQHRYPFVGLDLETASIQVTGLDGTAHIYPVIKNNMWFLPKGTPHQEMSITAPARHIVAIDLKDETVPEASNTTGFPTKGYAGYQKMVLDNDRVTVWDCAWPPGVKGVTSFNSRDMFLAFAEGGDFSIESGAAPVIVEHYDAGQAIFLPGGHVRTLSSVHGTIHAMLVEVK